MTEQTKSLTLAQIKNYNTTLVSFHQYLSEVEELFRKHLYQIETQRSYLKTQQKEVVDMYKIIKGLRIDEEETED